LITDFIIYGLSKYINDKTQLFEHQKIHANPDSIFCDGNLERTDTIKPIFDLGILFIFPPGDTLSWGLSARLRVMPLNAQLAGQTTSYGPWKIENVWEAGVFVRIAIR